MEPIKVFSITQNLSITDERVAKDGVKEYEHTFNTHTDGTLTPHQAIDALVILTKVLMAEAKIENPMSFFVPVISQVMGVDVFVGQPLDVEEDEEEKKRHAKFSN